MLSDTDRDNPEMSRARISDRPSECLPKICSSASGILAFTRKKAASPVQKLIKSAVANAVENHGVSDVDNLVVDRIMVDEGPALKRFTPRARGRATPIRKRTSHIRVMLREIGG